MVEQELKSMIIKKYGSVRQFSQEIDIPYTTLDSILKRGIDNSNLSNVKKICKKLNLSVDKLADNHQLVSAFSFDNAECVSTNFETEMIPILGTIKAGTAIEAQEDILEYVDIPKEWTRGNKIFFGLKISGDSMYPKYLENDIVIFEQAEDYTCANKKDCAVLVNGNDATFKNVSISDNGITLVPLNPNNQDGYQATFYSKEEIEKIPVRIIGIAKEKRTRL